MKREILYAIITDTDEKELIRKYDGVIDTINYDDHESMRSEYSTTFQVGGMKFGKVVHSIAIFLTEKY